MVSSRQGSCNKPCRLGVTQNALLEAGLASTERLSYLCIANANVALQPCRGESRAVCNFPKQNAVHACEAYDLGRYICHSHFCFLNIEGSQDS